MQDTAIKTWGNSFGVTLSKPFALATNWNIHTPVHITYGQDQIVIKKKKPHYTLAELLKGQTRDDFHPEFNWGPDVGKEIVEY